MDHRKPCLAVILALLLAAPASLADQGAPVYQANGTKPIQGGTCTAERVQIEWDTGKVWCCGAGGAGKWGWCGDAWHAQSATTAGAADALTGDTTPCTGNNFAKGINQSGVATCAQPAYSGLSGLPTLAPLGAQFIVSAADPTLTAERVATSTASISVDTATAGQIKWNIAAVPGHTHNAGTDITSGALPLARLQDNDTVAGLVLFSGGAGGDPAYRSMAPSDLPAHTHAAEDIVAGGVMNTTATNARAFENAAVASLGACSGSTPFWVQVKRAAGAPDQVFVCLQNSDATWGWAMFGLAVK